MNDKNTTRKEIRDNFWGTSSQSKTNHDSSQCGNYIGAICMFLAFLGPSFGGWVYCVYLVIDCGQILHPAYGLLPFIISIVGSVAIARALDWLIHPPR